MSSEGDTLGPTGQVRPEPVKGSVFDAEMMVESVQECGVGHKVEGRRAIKQGEKDRVESCEEVIKDCHNCCFSKVVGSNEAVFFSNTGFAGPWVR